MTWRTRVLTSSGAVRPWVNGLIMAVTIALLAGFTITYVSQQQRKICGIIVLLDDRNQSLPPSNDPDTVRFRVELHHYREGLGC